MNNEKPWSHSLDPADFVERPERRGARHFVILDASARELRALTLYGEGMPVDVHFGHVLAIPVPAGVRGDDLGERILGLDLEPWARAWEGLEYDERRGARVGRWAEGFGPGSPRAHELAETVERLARLVQPACTCEQVLDEALQSWGADYVRQQIEEDPRWLAYHDEALVVDADDAEAVGARWLATQDQE